MRADSSLLQPASSSLGMATLSKLRRLSIMRQQPKQRTIGSGIEFDAMLAENGLTRASFSLDRGLGSPTSTDGGRMDTSGNPILGGELVVKVVDAQVWDVSGWQLKYPAHSGASSVSIKPA